MQNFLNRLGNAIILLQNQRAIQAKQYEDLEDYAIHISSAHTFFSTFEYYIRQRMNTCILDVDDKLSAIFDNITTIAINALTDTLIDYGKRQPKKRWFHV